MKCLLDLDGVLVDFVGGAAKFHGKEERLPVIRWDFVADWGLTPNEFWSPLGRSFWADLEPTPECFGILSEAERVFGRENICLLSSPCATDGCCDGKLDWIKKHLPQYARRFLFGPRKEFCAAPNRVLVDDSDDNVRAFRNAGGAAVLVPRLWNANANKDALTETASWMSLAKLWHETPVAK